MHLLLIVGCGAATVGLEDDTGITCGEGTHLDGSTCVADADTGDTDTDTDTGAAATHGDTPGWYNGSTLAFHYLDSNSASAVETSFTYEPSGTITPLMADWDGL